MPKLGTAVFGGPRKGRVRKVRRATFETKRSGMTGGKVRRTPLGHKVGAVKAHKRAGVKVKAHNRKRVGGTMMRTNVTTGRMAMAKKTLPKRAKSAGLKTGKHKPRRGPVPNRKG